MSVKTIKYELYSKFGFIFVHVPEGPAETFFPMTNCQVSQETQVHKIVYLRVKRKDVFNWKCQPLKFYFP